MATTRGAGGIPSTRPCKSSPSQGWRRSTHHPPIKIVVCAVIIDVITSSNSIIVNIK